MRVLKFSATLLGCLVLSALIAYPAWADVYASCSRCSRFVTLHEGGGGGYARDWRGFCSECEELVAMLEALVEHEETADADREPERETPRETIDRIRGDEFAYGDHRYVLFADGTLIDMRHFMYATMWANDFGEVLTDVGGWMYEVYQWADGQDSGHPLGGNEDLASNADGADFGDEHFDGDGGGDSGSLPDQVADYLVGEHGPIVDHWTMEGPRDPGGADSQGDWDDYLPDWRLPPWLRTK